MSSSTSTDQELFTQEIRPKSSFRNTLPSFTTLCLIAYFIISLLMNGDIRPLVKRGFFCNDSSIKYPFKKDTISVKLLMLIALIIPAVVIKFCDINLQELIKNGPNIYIPKIANHKRRKVSGDSEELNAEEAEEQELMDLQSPTRRRLVTNGKDLDNELPASTSDTFTAVPLDRDEDADGSSRLCLMIRRTFGDVQLFLFGFCTTMLFTGIGKITCGRFRPHFLQRCQPNVDCSSYPDDSPYVESFTCTNSELTSRDMSYITTSWPSGHAAIMFFSMTYMIVYLNRFTLTKFKLSTSRQPRVRSPLLFNGLYVLMIGLAGYIAGTRISDYHHHTLDVFSGALIGFSIALALIRSSPMRISLGTTF